LADPIKQHFKNLPQTTQANLLQQRQDIDNSLQMTPQGAVIANQDAFGRVMSEVPNVAALTAWHGTPHKILGKFDINKVGTGEGAQAYGHGMYFAENPSVATQYRNILSKPEFTKNAEGMEMREVYYDDNAVPFGHSNATVFSEDVEDMKLYINHMKEAFTLPILFPDSFTGDPYI
jgi:hypothetical protein